MIDYHGKRFMPISNSANGETSKATIFEYQQQGKRISCLYTGGAIDYGHLLGTVADNGQIQMVYHQLNNKGELRTGKCLSTPEWMPNGKLRLHEKWEWTSDDRSSGNSVLEEI
jgi:hypothetical protein